MTSAASVQQTDQQPRDSMKADGLDGVWLQGVASAYEKCVRCWHHREDVGSDAEHPELCGRCVENVLGSGEERHYA